MPAPAPGGVPPRALQGPPVLLHGAVPRGGTQPRCPAVFFLDPGGACGVGEEAGCGAAAGSASPPLDSVQGLWSGARS